MKLMFCLLLVLSALTPSDKKVNEIVEAYLDAIGGIEKWQSIKTLHEENLAWSNFNVHNAIGNDIIADLEPTLHIKDINFPNEAVVRLYNSQGAKESTFTYDKHGAHLEMHGRSIDLENAGIPIPISLNIIDWYIKENFEFVKKSNFKGGEFNVLKRYDNKRKAWWFYYFNTESHFLEYFHEHEQYTILTKLSSYLESDGLLYPEFEEMFREGVLFFKSQILKFQANSEYLK